MTFSPIRIGDHLVGPDSPPFIIAEMSGNHNQSLQRALDLVDAAAETELMHSNFKLIQPIQ